MDETYPEFEKALLQFEQFLIAQGWPPQLLGSGQGTFGDDGAD